MTPNQQKLAQSLGALQVSLESMDMVYVHLLGDLESDFDRAYDDLKDLVEKVQELSNKDL